MAAKIPSGSFKQLNALNSHVKHHDYKNNVQNTKSSVYTLSLASYRHLCGVFLYDLLIGS